MKQRFQPPPLSPLPSRIPSRMLKFKYPRTDGIKFQVSKMGDGRTHSSNHSYVFRFIIFFPNKVEVYYVILSLFQAINVICLFVFIYSVCVCLGLCVYGTCFRLFASICSVIHAFWHSCILFATPFRWLFCYFSISCFYWRPLFCCFSRFSLPPHTIPISLLFPRVYVI